MKKLNPITTIMVMAAAAVTLALTACENQMVNALMLAPAQLDNITMSAADSSGNNAELNYGLQPNFSPKKREYYIMVPRNAEQITIKGISSKDAVINYKMITQNLNTGLIDEYENDTGVFSSFMFPARSCEVYLTVNIKNMETSVYKLTVYRQMPAWITKIDFETDVAPGHKYPFSPGFNPLVTDYTVGVNYDTNSFSVNSFRRRQFSDDNDINIVYQNADGTPINTTMDEKPVGWSPTDPVPTPSYAKSEVIPFPYNAANPSQSVMEKIIRIVVTFPIEDPQPLIYTLKVRRPAQVTARAGIVYRDENCFKISGEERDYHFQQGEPVTFTVTPPFGYTTAGVNAVSAGKPVTLFPSGSTYSFIMPGNDVVLTGQWQEIPKATDANIRYVWEYGIGDGSQWCRASCDLQKLIDGYTGVAPNDYEIWLAAGNITPEWSWVGGARPSWATAVGADQTSWDHHCFVLKNGVKIYGGFKGTEITQADKTSRDINANQTFLSGYKEGEGYTRHLVVAVGINQPTLLEGLTITKSEAGGRVSNIVINGANLDLWSGAGAYTVNCTNDLVFSNVKFLNNFTMYGAGVRNTNSGPTFRRCEFTGNSAYSYGGAIFSDGAVAGSSAPLVDSCVISGNQAGSYGAGILHTSGVSTITIVNTLVTNNYAVNYASGVYATGPAKIINCTIVKNTGQRDLQVNSAASEIRNTIAWGNSNNSSVPAAAGALSDNRIQGYTPAGGTLITSGTTLTQLGLTASYLPAGGGTAGITCLNTGDDMAYNEAIYGSNDLAGNNRKQGTIDIGAYEQ